MHFLSSSVRMGWRQVGGICGALHEILREKKAYWEHTVSFFNKTIMLLNSYFDWFLALMTRLSLFYAQATVLQGRLMSHDHTKESIVSKAIKNTAFF